MGPYFSTVDKSGHQGLKPPGVIGGICESYNHDGRQTGSSYVFLYDRDNKSKCFGGTTSGYSVCFNVGFGMTERLGPGVGVSVTQQKGGSKEVIFDDKKGVISRR